MWRAATSDDTDIVARPTFPARGRRLNVQLISSCKDLPIYTFTSRCKEDSSAAFENGTIDIVRNAAGDPSMTNTGIASLLQYVESDKANGSDSLTAQLSQAVRDAHEDEE